MLSRVTSVGARGTGATVTPPGQLHATGSEPKRRRFDRPFIDRLSLVTKRTPARCSPRQKNAGAGFFGFRSQRKQERTLIGQTSYGQLRPVV